MKEKLRLLKNKTKFKPQIRQKTLFRCMQDFKEGMQFLKLPNRDHLLSLMKIKRSRSQRYKKMKIL